MNTRRRVIDRLSGAREYCAPNQRREGVAMEAARDRETTLILGGSGKTAATGVWDV
jgi:hypothetical protein